MHTYEGREKEHVSIVLLSIISPIDLLPDVLPCLGRLD
jgi:uncharacterized membrane protein YkvA (DUF1232 family)